MVLGIEDSPDPLLQFRTFFYRDAQLHRIGVNGSQIPGGFPLFTINAFPTHLFSSQLSVHGTVIYVPEFRWSDEVDANHGKNPQYMPNSFRNKFRPDAADSPYELTDKTVSRKS
jgi:catalase